MQNEKQFAPVMIPTLCRFEHFKRCVESLSKCTGASETELYIGLDYPAKESHRKGYEKILAYVDSIQGFKKVHISKREVNFGQKKNTKDLREQVRQAGFEYYIISEDDNEFAPNFLLFMNQCLVKYKDNPQVMAVCGFSHFEWNDRGSYKYNAFPMHGFCAFGMATWFSKLKEYQEFYTDQEIVSNPKLVHKLFKCRQHKTIHRMLFRQGISGGDLRRVFYAELTNKYSIFPAVSKVRNHGYDGEGSHCTSINVYAKMPIDTSDSFVLDDFELKEYKDIKRLHDIHYAINFRVRAITRVEYAMYRCTGKVLRDFKIVRWLMNWRVKNILNTK